MATDASCASEQWMDNQSGKSPCYIAPLVGQICNAEYNVSLTNFQENDYIPNSTVANACTCSWSIYNLLSACSYCFGQTQFTSWTTWNASCGNYVSTTSAFPSTISEGVPQWAIKNPSQWNDATFNITEVSYLVGQNLPDVFNGTAIPTPTATSTPKSEPSTPVGAIVGGVIGGMAIIIIGGLITFWAMRRHRSQATDLAPLEVRSFNPSQLAFQRSSHNRSTMQQNPSHLPRGSISSHPAPSIRSTTSLTPTTRSVPISTSPRSGGPISDAGDMISTFLLAHPTKRLETRSTSPSNLASDALSARSMTPPPQRARLNPPSYQAAMEPEPSAGVTIPGRRSSGRKQNRREGSVSGATSISGRSRTSTWESIQAGSLTEQSHSRSITSDRSLGGRIEGFVGAGDGSSGGGRVVIPAHSERAGKSGKRPPAV